MKKFGKLLLCFMLLFSLTAVVVGCQTNEDGGDEQQEAEKLQKAKDEAVEKLQKAYESVDLSKYAQVDVDFINQLNTYGLSLINGATKASRASEYATLTANLIKEHVAKVESSSVVSTGFSGVKSFVASSYAERTKILGLLEKYAVEAGLTGITVFEDSGFALYDYSVTKGTENYIPGYGFGIVSEGKITADLPGETNAAWKRYYHTYEASDPKSMNYGDDKGEVVGDLVGYTSDSYWGTKMNETKDGYVWYSSLANEMPQAQNKSSVTGLATIYKFEVKVGEQLKYATSSSKFAKYNGREVALEDYLTPYKLLHTQANGWKRGAENLEGASAIKGMAGFYNSTKDGYSDVAWEKVGISTSVEDGKAYLTFEFNQPCSSFYAMYYLASSLYAPIPQEFVDEIGGPSKYGKFDTDKGLTPADTTLSTGPYVLEAWEQDKQIVFKKNALYHNTELYQGVPGIHIAILKAATENREAAFNEFLAGKLSAVGIPSTKLQEYKNDPRAAETVGATTTKLNINTCTQEEWIKLFGENGSITQTKESDYWECEPALSNENFVKALSYAIDRVTLADTVGATPSVSYFGAAYMADPENGIAYNNTEAHKTAIADLIKGTDGYGYSLELARQYFKKACIELLATGAYKEGDTITLEMAWQSETNVQTYQNPLENFWKTAFNHESVCEGKLRLEIVKWVPAQWDLVYYDKMMVGQYDIGFGGVNGNPLNPLNFFEVLKSDNSSGFTLNWGPDTSEVSNDLVFDGGAWSFDSLWQAAETGGYFENGNVVDLYAPELTSSQVNEDGSATLVYKANVVTNREDLLEEVYEQVSVDLADVKVFSYFAVDTEGGYAYDEDSVAAVYDDETDTITVTVSAELYEKYSGSLAGFSFGFDFYFSTVILEIDGSGIVSCYDTLPVQGE